MIESQFALVKAPRWSEIVTVATSGTVGTFNTDLVGPQVAAVGGQSSVGARQKYLSVCAMAADCWIVLAATAAKAGNIVVATAGTNVIGGCWPMTAGIPQGFFIPNDMSFLGFRTAGGAGFLTFYISSDKA